MNSRVLPIILAIACMIGAYVLGRRSARLLPPAEKGEQVESLPTARAGDGLTEWAAQIRRESDKTQRNRDLAMLFSEWLESDPRAALAEVRRFESLRYNAARVVSAFEEWARNHPREAAALLSETLDGRQSDARAKPAFLDGIDPPEFMLGLVRGLGLADAQLAASTLAAAVDSPFRESAIEVLLQDWYPGDSSAARRWAASLDQPEARATAIAAVARKAGQIEPGAGIRWAEGLPAQDQAPALVALVSQWGQRHSADAFGWAQALPDSELKFAIMPTALRHFAITNPGPAADWLNTYEASPAMDDSVAAYARAIVATNPPAALGSAAAITEPEKRSRVLSRLAREWLQNDPQAARHFIDVTPLLPSTLKAELLGGSD